VIARIREELAAILSSPEMQAKFITFSYAASTDSPDDFARKIATEVDHWRAIIRDRGIHVDN
jgi:tripartite-type tricarboxylate transporter receptor subunit TctC